MSQTNLVANTYNPHNQTPGELIDGFVVRKKEFEALYGDIKADAMEHPPQHAIVHGRRGSGKTTFLLRLYYEVKRDPALHEWLQPVIFNEEQYSVRTLYKLWENVAAGLENESGEFADLPDIMQARSDAGDYDEICFEILTSVLRKHKKKLLLLIDNFGVMLHKFDDRDQRRLREILITCADIKIVGASAVALECTFDYSKPFFEFFKIIELSGLSKEETVTLLRALGERYGKPQIDTIIDRKPGKIEALRRLTDGVPRTMILLFEIFVDDAGGDSFKDLEMVLDRVTPLYKHRMDELSAQQQEIVDIIALHWDAVPAKEIARKSRMESKAVSAQLRILEKNRIVIKKPTSTKNHLYQISERFFNIWYLMRYGRKKEKNQVVWLTRFLEEWCEREELAQRAQDHLNAMQNGNDFNPARLSLAELFYRQRKNKSLALEYIAKAYERNSDQVYGIFYSLILLWNDEMEKSFLLAKPLFEDAANFERNDLGYPFREYLLLLIAKRQYFFAYRLFSQSPLDLRGRYRPMYYALMYFMQDSHPDEFKKMGSELEQTVMEIVNEITAMAGTM